MAAKEAELQKLTNERASDREAYLEARYVWIGLDFIKKQYLKYSWDLRLIFKNKNEHLILLRQSYQEANIFIDVAKEKMRRAEEIKEKQELERKSATKIQAW